MKMAKIPTFKTEAEEGEFWDTHDSADYWDDTEEVELELSPDLAQAIKDRYVIRITPGQRKKLEKIAEKEHINSQKVISKWVNQGHRRKRRL